jgi:tetratricopeptide (TPR) repeat protein
VAEARLRLARARAARHGNELVEKQAAASLAMALSRSCGRPEPKCEDELARNIAEVDTNFSRWNVVHDSVRAKLSEGYHARGRCVEAELLGPGACPDKWSDPRFVESMIARVSGPPTAFDRFMIDGSDYKRDGLRTELGLLYFRRGDFEAAKRQFQDKDVGAALLGTDPFVIHIRDCHDCDQKKYANAKWTRAKFALRMIDLRKLAQRPDKVGASAAFDLGNGYYNITWHGNARSFLGGTHVTADIDEAGTWYKRAFDAFPDREDKARAAFMAAKSELARMLEKQAPNPGGVDQLPIPATWFPIVRGFADTKYYREILQECGHYRRWVKRQK